IDHLRRYEGRLRGKEHGAHHDSRACGRHHGWFWWKAPRVRDDIRQVPVRHPRVLERGHDEQRPSVPAHPMPNRAFPVGIAELRSASAPSEIRCRQTTDQDVVDVDMPAELWPVTFD